MEVAGGGVGEVLAEFQQLAKGEVVGRFPSGSVGPIDEMPNLIEGMVEAGGGGVEAGEVPAHENLGALFGVELTEQLRLGLVDGAGRGWVGHGGPGGAEW